MHVYTGSVEPLGTAVRRLRKFILITGTLLCVLIAAAFAVSGWWWAWVAIRNGPFFGIHAGALEYWSPSPKNWAAGVERHEAGLRFALVGRMWTGGFALPLVYPFAAAAIATLLVWRFGAKAVKPGHCRCGYDLKGNTSGVCPECGDEVQA